MVVDKIRKDIESKVDSGLLYEVKKERPKKEEPEPEVMIKDCCYLPNQLCHKGCIAYIPPGKGHKSTCARLQASIDIVYEVSIRRDFYGSKS